MTTASAVIFLLTYLGVALGRVPGLMLDRTGIALLGAIAMVVCGAVTIDQATDAIDIPTLLLLYALMIVSAQLRLGGFYTWAAFKSTRWLDQPRCFLLAVMTLSALLSAILANDIVCLAFTPVILLTVRQAGRNPAPYLLGLALSSNIGSAATIIGNPQNMLIGQVGRLHFGQFLAWCGPPAIASLAAAYGWLCLRQRQALTETDAKPFPAFKTPWPDFNRWQSAKGLAAAFCLMTLFFMPYPRELCAIGVAGVLLCSRRLRSRNMMELVDWQLIILFCALFIVIHGIGIHGIPAAVIQWLSRHGVDPAHPPVLALVSTVMSNLVSNVPASLLLLKFLDPSQPVQWYVLALSSTFAGNLILIGSIANLIVIEQAALYGVNIGFREHARTGVPVTLLSLAVLGGWMLIMS